jgi:hypothetical protein
LVGELIIELIVERSDELSEDQRFWRGTEILLQVELGEGLGAAVGSQCSIGCKILCVDKPISKDSLRLMHPKFDEVVGFLDGLGLGSEQTLEYVGEMSDIELIMEVDGGLLEGTLHFLMQVQC